MFFEYLDGNVIEAAKSRGVKHVELDALYWESGWKESALEVFQRRIEQSLAAESWVVDGNVGKVREVIWSRADTVIWINLPLRTIRFRFFLRSFRRAITREELWNGCRESLKHSIFQRNSLLMWILKSHSRKQETYPLLMKDPAYSKVRFHHLRSVAEVSRLVKGL